MQHIGPFIVPQDLGPIPVFNPNQTYTAAAKDTVVRKHKEMRRISENCNNVDAELATTNATLVAQLAETAKALKQLAEADQNQETMRKERQNKYNEHFDPNNYCYSHS